MQNASPDFGFWTRNSSWKSHWFLVFHTPSEKSKKGMRKRYAELTTLLSVFKGTLDIS